MIQHLDEGLGRAVHDRHFRARQLDDRHCRRPTRTWRHQVLDVETGYAGGVAEHVQPGLHTGLARAGNGYRGRGCRADERPPRIGRRGPDGDAHIAGRLQADAGEDGRARQGVLTTVRRRQNQPSLPSDNPPREAKSRP